MFSRTCTDASGAEAPDRLDSTTSHVATYSPGGVSGGMCRSIQYSSGGAVGTAAVAVVARASGSVGLSGSRATEAFSAPRSIGTGSSARGRLLLATCCPVCRTKPARLTSTGIGRIW